MPIAAPDLPQTEAVITAMTNAFRVENHLSPVASNPALQLAAKAFADYLAKTGSFAHTADGRQPADRARAAGYDFCIVAENIASHQSNRGFATSELASRAVEGWEASPPHRANLLQADVTDTGIGIAQSADVDPKFLTVQLFGRPGSFKYAFTIENRSGTSVSYRLGDQMRVITNATEVRHTACRPRDVSFSTGKVTATFQAHNGATYLITRGVDGAPRVDMKPARAIGNATFPSRMQTVKAVKLAH